MLISLLRTKVKGDKRSRERRFHRWNLQSREQKFLSTKVPVTDNAKSDSSDELMFLYAVPLWYLCSIEYCDPEMLSLLWFQYHVPYNITALYKIKFKHQSKTLLFVVSMNTHIFLHLYMDQFTRSHTRYDCDNPRLLAWCCQS